MTMSIPQQKKIFACASPHESAMSSAKIALAAARSDATGEGSLGLLAPRPDLVAKHAAAASTMAAAKRSTARAVVRGRSALLPLVPRHPGPLERLEFVFAPCTPARSGAEKMDCRCLPRRWVRGAVLARTGSELRQNRQITEIVGELCPVLGFSRQASRDAGGRVYAHARAYRGVEKHRTTEPAFIIHINQLVNGSEVVLRWFWPEPAYAYAVEMAENRGFRVKYWAETCLSASPAWLPCRWRGSERGAGAKVSGSEFGQACGVGLVGGIDLDQAQGAVRNGGFLRVCEVRSAHVGTAILERMAQSGGNASMLGRRRQLDRLTGGAALAIGRRGLGASAIGQVEGGGAPFAGRQILRPFAPAIFQISTESHFHACPGDVAETRQGFGGQIGSGWKSAPFDPQPQTGRGVIANWGLRRCGHGNVGGARVN